MLRSNFFKARAEENNKNYQKELLQVIRKYISRNDDKRHKKSGIEVEESLMKFIINEGMTDTEMMAHMLSCIKMQYGTGALGKSIELRSDILAHLFKKLHIPEFQFKTLFAHYVEEEVYKQLVVATYAEGYYPINEERLRMTAMLDLVEVAMIKQLNPLSPSLRM